MHMLPPVFSRPTARPALPGIALTGLLSIALLAGCASKNPLMEAPAGMAAAPSSAATTDTTTDTASAATANAGLKRTTPASARRFLGILSPYRIDIPQGNFVSEEMVLQLKEGMTQDQVRFALGTPLIADIFHADRWDYVFRMLKRNDEVLSSRVTVFFKDGVVSRFEGGNLPTEVDYLEILAGGVPEKTKPLAPAVPVAPSSARQPQ
ncbi:outer membrane protein assembly factor BamE [Actimicrobium sp. CCI2.3]|nr:outer membrane protein assembly factor BamE [Actimicrobium sp. CCI2.3]MDY7576063.1 outer membrane protein assembly factor BamE [Actimicrobium sp. CCI2.3]MEB0022993.1 outer membrane protein assembly factor BamE [Actimicrobium sp. CCI2.3]